MYFSQTWNLTIAKNTNVNQQKSKNHKELNFSREKVQKYEKNWKSKNDFSEPEISLKLKRPLLEALSEESFKKKNYRKKGILWSKIWKKLKVQKWCQNGPNSII